MTTSVDAFNTPGQLIERLLEERDWTKKTLALVLGMDEAALNRVLAAKRPLTAEMALMIAEVLPDANAEDLLALQQKHDLAQARLAVMPDTRRQTRAELFGDLKVNHLLKRGWLAVRDEKDVNAIEQAVNQFFGKPFAEVMRISHAAKKTDANEEATASQIAWIWRVRQLGRLINPGAPYSAQKLRAQLPRLQALMASPEQIEKVPGVLLDAGVRLVVVESLPSAKIDGVCLWLDDGSPVIGLSARFDRIDNFWFVLRHEIEHVLNGDGKDDPLGGHLDTDLVGKRASAEPTLPEIEIKANKAASNFCVSTPAMDTFFEENNPYFSERKLLEFANECGVHPGILAGQLQHRTGRYDRFRAHLEKVRAHLVKSAVTDGWGNLPQTSEKGAL
ncbi:helix-turn-helix domain-containing protein [Hydrogenophaga sp. OTU3427]|uniref:helix-turn-helix domain-containing protein n=1 Tax=Hydrogenophaga sp. OTU3427 TaxID=3043856 RepID=UPI00313F1129